MSMDYPKANQEFYCWSNRWTGLVIDSKGLVVEGGELKSEWGYTLYNRQYRLIYYY